MATAERTPIARDENLKLDTARGAGEKQSRAEEQYRLNQILGQWLKAWTGETRQ
jgi:hypothetical protein